ncbi:VOC family protein [Synoicihabitans lomoniglobus]|uniref:VOC family protein n=1 Tax=Synoicihabitans lomoniglobus TaxID=2909285 RepID=A0AAF0CQY7_9BACT|nr:VOC family protein [Opitutaceae bacterium LMO-M01]WED66444.1 VOC family protein [Opitutaceae bacterium LMO-M01]
MKLLTFFCSLMVVTGAFAAEETARSSDLPADALVPQRNMLHIGIVVKDMDATLAHWTKFLGLAEKPATIVATGHHANPTVFRGKPSAAKVRLAFIQLENIQVELLSPLDDEPNHWQEFLDTKGEGVHHMAFAVKGLGEAYVDAYDAAGLPIIMSGGWDGGEYGYADTHDALGATVELLERYGEP